MARGLKFKLLARGESLCCACVGFADSGVAESREGLLVRDGDKGTYLCGEPAALGIDFGDGLYEPFCSHCYAHSREGDEPTIEELRAQEPTT